MKKIMLLFAAVAFMTAANAQVVVGLQGGFLQQKSSQSTDLNYTLATDYVGALRVGYMVTPKLYVGLAGGIMGEGYYDICVCLVRLLVNIITFNFVLICINQCLDAIVSLYNAKIGITLQRNGLSLKIHLLKSQLTNLLTIV